jgi:AP2 domain/HNH endonuclease
MRRSDAAERPKTSDYSENVLAKEMKLILLTRGLVAIVDDCDYARLSRIKWQVSSSGNSFYAVHNDAKNRKTAIFMHRLTIYAPSGKQVDHINGDTLDNCRHNLRLASPPQNAHNCKVARKNNTSGFKGVSFNKPRGRWIAYIKVRGKKHNLGYFKTAEEAARSTIARRGWHSANSPG